MNNSTSNLTTIMQSIQSKNNSTTGRERNELDVMRFLIVLKRQAAQIQKVSAQLATASPSRGGLKASKVATGQICGVGPGTQMVVNP
jgi:hypothetical protein